MMSTIIFETYEHVLDLSGQSAHIRCLSALYVAYSVLYVLIYQTLQQRKHQRPIISLSPPRGRS